MSDSTPVPGRRLQGKIALVTGAGAGIGRSVALRFAAEGATVLAASRGENVRTISAEAEGEVVPLLCDMSDPAQVAAMVGACRERFGRLDVLVNNAGIAHTPARLHELELDTWDRVMATNVRGAFLVLKHAIGLMRASGGGAIVNMASYGSIRASAGSSAYIVSKAAMHSLTQQVAVEYAADNIRCNSVAPGVTLTPLVRAAPAEIIAPKIGATPQGRAAEPEEVASLALFLASDEASHITGGLYLIDGGRSAL